MNKTAIGLIILGITIITFCVYGYFDVNRINSQPYEDYGTATTEDGKVLMEISYKVGVSENVYYLFALLIGLGSFMILTGILIRNEEENNTKLLSIRNE